MAFFYNRTRSWLLALVHKKFRLYALNKHQAPMQQLLELALAQDSAPFTISESPEALAHTPRANESEYGNT